MPERLKGPHLDGEQPADIEPSESEVASLPMVAAEKSLSVEPVEGIGGRPEQEPELLKQAQLEVEELFRPLDAAVTKPSPEVIAAYVEKHLPTYLQETSGIAHTATTLIAFGRSLMERLGRFKTEGRERIPKEGACVIVANHSRLYDETKVASMLGRSSHIVAADMHFNISPVYSWLLRKLGVVKVDSTLGNLSEEAKIALMSRVPSGDKAYYQKVIDRDHQGKGLAGQREFIRTAVALLAEKKPLILFPEGLWTYEGNKMHRAYPGIELISREYKRLTGEDLPIVPLGISDRTIQTGEPFVLNEGETVDVVMRKVAELLPEAERGYYNDAT